MCKMNLFENKDSINCEAIESFGRAGRSAKGLRLSAVDNKRFNI